VSDPTGRFVDYYSGNLIANDGRAKHEIPFAVNDAAGLWTVRVVEITTGCTKSLRVQLE
jgi:hypothetical protein